MPLKVEIEVTSEIQSVNTLETLEVTISKSILKVYFIVRVCPEVYLEYSSILTG